MTAAFKTDPSLETQMLRPRANESSAPLNHFDTMADWATPIDSPPIPKIILPKSSKLNFCWNPPIIKTNYPKVNVMVNRISPSLNPTVSKNMPPNTGSIIFGSWYTV